ncbi:MAG: hypothetical protein H6765_04890 [Candidatus Peribacteria bacterium]|nr:MAG: hypothetical protein H6765_04890 [Candidatus Peribacteria bacterium]
MVQVTLFTQQLFWREKQKHTGGNHITIDSLDYFFSGQKEFCTTGLRQLHRVVKDNDESLYIFFMQYVNTSSDCIPSQQPYISEHFVRLQPAIVSLSFLHTNMQHDTQYQLLTYYKFVDIADPHAEVAKHARFCKDIGIL